MLKNLIAFRISTALLLIAILLFPFASLLVPAPDFVAKEGSLHKFFGWIFYQLSPMLLVCSLIASLCFIILSLLKARRKLIFQHAIEFLISLFLLINIPAIF